MKYPIYKKVPREILTKMHRGITLNPAQSNWNYQDEEGNTILHYYCKFRDNSTVKSLVKFSPEFIDINKVNKDGNTPLHLAVISDCSKKL